MTAVRSAALLVAFLFLAAGCEASVSIGGLSQDDLETQIEATAEEASPEFAPYEADCADFPDDREEGTQFQCTVTDVDGDAFPVAVTIDAEGGANFTIGG